MAYESALKDQLKSDCSRIGSAKTALKKDLATRFLFVDISTNGLLISGWKKEIDEIRSKKRELSSPSKKLDELERERMKYYQSLSSEKRAHIFSKIDGSEQSFSEMRKDTSRVVKDAKVVGKLCEYIKKS